MNYQKMCQKELTHNLKYGLSFSFGNVNNKKYLYVTCDNCSEQNKNNLSLMDNNVRVVWWYLYKFYNPGHTKFICDASFGSIEKLIIQR